MSDIFRDYSFGGWISHARLEKGMTLRALANKLGTDAGNLSKLERGELPPPKKAKKVDEICDALGNPDMAPLLKSIAFQHHLSNLQTEFFGGEI